MQQTHKRQRCLTLMEPWATAIIRLGKDVENRRWRTNIRGRIAIHAGRQYWSEDAEWIRSSVGVDVPKREELTLGAIIGTVELYGCVSDSDSPWAFDRCWHWLMRDPEPFDEPISYRGRQGFWWANLGRRGE